MHLSVTLQDLKLAARFASNLHSASDRRRFFTDYFCFFKSPADLHHQARRLAVHVTDAREGRAGGSGEGQRCTRLEEGESAESAGVGETVRGRAKARGGR